METNRPFSTKKIRIFHIQDLGHIIKADLSLRELRLPHDPRSNYILLSLFVLCEGIAMVSLRGLFWHYYKGGGDSHNSVLLVAIDTF